MEFDLLANVKTGKKDKTSSKRKSSSSQSRKISKKFSQDQDRSSEDQQDEQKNNKPVLYSKAGKEAQKNLVKNLTIKPKSSDVNNEAVQENNINDLLKDDDSHQITKKDLREELNKMSSGTSLGKRITSDFLKENSSFIQFEGDDNGDRRNNRKDALADMDRGHREIKKVKSDNKNQKDTKEPSFKKEIDRPRSSDLFQDEVERRLAPWMSSSTRKVNNTLIRFHNEIIDFAEHVGPSKKDQAIRKKSFEK